MKTELFLFFHPDDIIPGSNTTHADILTFVIVVKS